MKTLIRVLTLSLVVLVGPGAFLAAEESPAPSKAKIASLIGDLGAEKAAVRDRASKDLEAIGEPAVPALKEAANSDDPEVAWRARTILDHIRGAATRPEGAPRGRAGRSLHSFNIRINPGANGNSVIITQDGTGRVSLRVTEEKDGKRVTKEYEAESPEAFKKKYPELAKQYGVGEAGAPRVLRDFMPKGRAWDPWNFDEDFFDRDWPKGFGREMDKIQERMRKQMDDLFRRHDLKPWGWRPRLRDWKENEPPARSPEEAEEQAREAGPAPEARPEPRGQVRPATLGVRVAEVAPALRAHLKLGEQEGVLVEEIVPGQPAEKSGFKTHDVIVGVNGKTVKGVWELRRVLRESAESDADGVLEIDVIRGGAKQTLPVKME